MADTIIQSEDSTQEEGEDLTQWMDSTSQKTHYRLFPEWPLPEEDSLPMAGVQVGTCQDSGDAIVHVNRGRSEYDDYFAAREQEPLGTFLGHRLSSMWLNHPRQYKCVAEAVVEETDPEGNTVLRRRKIVDLPSQTRDKLGPDFDHPKVPDKVKKHDTNLVPHTFGGVDHY